MCKGRKATRRTRQSHMNFGSPPKCTWLRFFLAANARVCCSVEARKGCGRPEKHPPVHFGRAPQCTGFAFTIIGQWSMGPRWAFTRRFEHAQTASSQPSRMNFGTDSKCTCFPHSGLGVWGHVGPLHGDLGPHKPLRHNLHECISARILNASGPRARVWGVGPCWAFTWRFGHAQSASSPT